MKKTYNAPSISVYNIGKTNIMAASDLSLGDDYNGSLGGIRSKRAVAFDDYDDEEL